MSLFAVCLAVCCGSAFGQSRGRISSGGFERYKAHRWGLVRGQYENKTEQEETVTSLVHQTGGAEHQYARQLVLPPQSIRSSQWPVFVESTETSAFEFESMSVSGTGGRETIRRRTRGELMDNFAVSATGQTAGNNVGSCMNLFSRDSSPQEVAHADVLLVALRAAASLPSKMIGGTDELIGVHPEALNAVDQMLICSSSLHEHPDSADAVRFWIERGGQALLLLNATGDDSAKALLGDALPFTTVDQTSLMQFPFKHHVATGGLRKEVDLSFEREFDEPVPFSRVVFDKGDLIWSVNGWPLLVELAIGKGRIYVATASCQVFVNGLSSRKLAPTASQLLEKSFQTELQAPLLTHEDLSGMAQAEIGYEIPSRTFPAIVLSFFVAAVAVGGWLLARKDRQSWLAVLAPVTAVLAALPGLAMGLAVRTAAPPTLLETRIVRAASGQTALVADGVVTVYQPEANTIKLTMTDHATMRNSDDSPSDTRQRFLWTDIGTHTLADFNQPVGITNYVFESVLRLPNLLKAAGTLDAEGLKVSISNSDILGPEDGILASTGPDIMQLRKIADGEFRSESADILQPGEISNEALISEKQVERKQLFRKLLDNSDRLEAFPSELSVMFWSQSPESPILTESRLRRECSTLFVVPLDLTSPEIGSEVLLTPVLLPYATIPDEKGAVSSAYFNRRREWIESSKPATTVLKFELPQVCRPFQFQDAELTIRIRAGSRPFTVFAGGLEGWTQLEQLNSPVGTFTFTLPKDALNGAGHDSVFVKLDVGKSEVASEDDGSARTSQDNYWKVERVLLQARGAKMRVQDLESES